MMKYIKLLLTWIAILGWFLFLFGGLFVLFAPTNWWISDQSYVSVETPTASGHSPQVEINILYQKNLFVHWNRLLYKESNDNWASICELEGEGRFYQVDNPITIELENLFSTLSCAKNLPPGQYSLELDIEVHDNIIVRNAFIESNIFEVTAPAAFSRKPNGVTPSKVEPERAQRHFRYHNPQSSLPPFLRWLFKGK